MLLRLAVALAIGLLLGLERGWEGRDLHTAQRTAGVRTFAAIGLIGGVAAQLGGEHAVVLLAAFAIALGMVLAVGYWRESEVDRDVSLTTSVTALATYGLGALAGRGELLAASSSAVVLTMILGFRPEIHALIRKIERTELLATFRLLLISVVMLPVLPNHALRSVGRVQSVRDLVDGGAGRGDFVRRILCDAADGPGTRDPGDRVVRRPGVLDGGDAEPRARVGRGFGEAQSAGGRCDGRECDHVAADHADRERDRSGAGLEPGVANRGGDRDRVGGRADAGATWDGTKKNRCGRAAEN